MSQQPQRPEHHNLAGLAEELHALRAFRFCVHLLHRERLANELNSWRGDQLSLIAEDLMTNKYPYPLRTGLRGAAYRGLMVAHVTGRLSSSLNGDPR
jgi:hypothetical protein